LIPKPTLLAAVRACPVNGVAGHAPQIFHHALLAYLKTATTGPAKEGFLAAYMAEILLSPSPFGYWPAVYWLCFHSQISMMMFWGRRAYIFQRNLFGINYRILVTGCLMLDRRNSSQSIIQYQVSSIQYPSTRMDNSKIFF